MSNPINLDQTHKDDVEGRNDRYWSEYHKQWITMWNDWYDCVI